MHLFLFNYRCSYLQSHYLDTKHSSTSSSNRVCYFIDAWRWGLWRYMGGKEVYLCKNKIAMYLLLWCVFTEQKVFYIYIYILNISCTSWSFAKSYHSLLLQNTANVLVAFDFFIKNPWEIGRLTLSMLPVPSYVYTNLKIVLF